VGRRRPTIRDVAEHAGVSKSLVSLVLRDSPKVSDRSREAVEQSIRELGYRPSATARSLVSGRSGLVGMVTTNLLDFFYFEVIEGVSRHLESTDGELFPLLIRCARKAEAEARAVEHFLELHVEGLMLMGTVLTDETIEAYAREVPISVVGHHTPSRLMDVVVSDDVRGGFLATQHLIDIGHHRIAHVRGEGNGAAEREEGFRRAVEAAGIEPVVIPGGYNVADGTNAMERFIDSTNDLPTAIFAANDLCAVGVMNAIRDTGRAVPADISVIGFDDIALAGWRGIELTTINQPTRQMGELAARLLTTRIADRTAPQQVQIEPALVIRSSTKPA
jgi:DNA-binding LacI/PurR family transcriptional regulator